ncbi:3-keto-disaccharide hydrolase [Larkinella terrae]|uniref:DUF1080 domain-containing protein n=1 Tax=Larkinella terrae TaxID=2025311 RepID=A0A7K0EHI7_9BACT|nr:DUF1080 domain-containing protein [Larkinella terrae]MRS61254.1 DUF1080 domain-containing protein [Larkinella terrae]
MRKILLPLLLLVLSIQLFAQAPNTLSAQEKKEGWKLLFNGKDVSGWHTYGKTGVGSAWIIENGALKLNVPERAGNKAKDGGDLATDQIFKGDFEFKADFKVERFTNSGIFFFVTEAPEYQQIYHTGLELQVLDNAIYEGAPENKHRVGDFFSVANARIREPKAVGEWNQIHFKLKNKVLSVYMNGYLIQEHNVDSADWKKRIAESNLKNAPISKGKLEGRIGLQDWGSSVWFRNIKIRQL